MPQPYIAQLALYRAGLARLYPDKTVRAALVFTAAPLFIELPAAAMDTALAALMAQPRSPDAAMDVDRMREGFDRITNPNSTGH